MAGAILASVSTPAIGTGDDTVLLNYPADVVPNDILVALIYADAGATQTIDFFNPIGGVFEDITNTATGVRRAVGAFYRTAIGNESSAGTTVFTVTTSALTGTIGGCIALFRQGHPLRGSIIATGTAGITGSTTPGPASITTVLSDTLCVSAIAYNNTGTIGAIAANSWAENIAEQNDGTNSYSFQTKLEPTATTISGGTATLGSSGQWGVITFAIEPLKPVFFSSSVIVN